MIAIRGLQALAAREPKVAFEYLQDALEQAQPEGYIRTFVDLGKGPEPILQTAVQRKVLPGYPERILAAMQSGAPKMILGIFSMLEVLSERESEVLRSIAAGRSNREIARALAISLGTVKTYVNNICAKLGVRNRTEATARAINPLFTPKSIHRPMILLLQFSTL